MCNAIKLIARITFLSLLIAACGSAEEPTLSGPPDAQAKSASAAGVAASPEAAPLPPAGREGFRGVWQLIPLDDDWMRLHGADEGLEAWYIALDGPAPREMDDHAPCPLPVRVFIGAFGDDWAEKRGLLACLAVCAPSDGPEGLHRGLWGKATRLAKIAVRHLDDPPVVIVDEYVYNMLEASSFDEAVEIDGATRVSEHRFTVPEILKLIDGDSSGRCIETN